ncbi:MAG: outer membrane protein assembly factor BamE [Rhodospirillaceae bacterium]
MPRTPVTRTFRLLAAGACALMIAGCAPQITVRGNLPNKERLAGVTPGDMTREEVAEILGSPSSITPFDSDVWLYISEKTQSMAFLEPKILERKIVLVRFDKKGVVKETKNLDLSNAKDVLHVQRVTPTAGNEITVWDQILTNFGRFNAPGGGGIDTIGQ